MGKIILSDRIGNSAGGVFCFGGIDLLTASRRRRTLKQGRRRLQKRLFVRRPGWSSSETALDLPEPLKAASRDG